MEAIRLLVFTDPFGKFGDRASIVVDEGRRLDDLERQALTQKLGTGETVFIQNIARAEISIMHYDGELDFAGVAALAAAWVLGDLCGKPIEVMHSKGGAITTWQTGDLTWVRASLAVMPPWNFEQLDSVAVIENLKPQAKKAVEHTMFWAWKDEPKGLIRARTFADDWGIPEAGGNGSGAMLLATQLNRQVEIDHGKGSIMFAKPAHNNCADIGGRVLLTGRTR